MICFWEDIEDKGYAIVTRISQEDGYGLTSLGVNAGIEEAPLAATVSSVIDILIDRGVHVKKVNVHLAVES